MKREDQKQKRIKFDPIYFESLKRKSDLLGLNFYELTEIIIDEFKKHIETIGNSEYSVVKPRLNEKVKSVWICKIQMKEVIEPLAFSLSVSSNTVVYNAFYRYKKIKDKR